MAVTPPRGAEATPASDLKAGPPGDDGVCARVGKRTASASLIPAFVAAALAFTGWAWPGWSVGATGIVIAVVAVAAAVFGTVVLVRRSRLWAQAEREARKWEAQWSAGGVSEQSPPEGWVRAVCGAPAPLFRGRGAVPMLRRTRTLAPVVLPLRTASGPLAAGHAVVVHARSDGAVLEEQARILVRTVQRRGPILIGRVDDGALFAADRWTAGAA